MSPVFFLILSYKIKETIKGIDRSDRRVVTNVPCAITVSSTPYFKQNIVPKEATGMAMMIVLIFMAISSNSPVVRRQNITNRGSSISLKTDIRRIFGPPAMCLAGIWEML